MSLLTRSIVIASLFWDLSISWIRHALGFSRAKRFQLGEEISPQLGDINSILLFGYMGMGDAVMFEPTLRAFLRRFPNASFDLIVGSGSQSRELLQHILGEQGRSFRSVVIADFKALTYKEWRATNESLVQNKYDACLAVYTTPTQYFIKAIESIPIRIGHLIRPQSWYKPRPNHLFNLARKVDQEIDEREPGRHFRLAQSVGIHANGEHPIPRIRVSEQDLEWAHTFLQHKGLLNLELMGVHLGVSRAMAWKKWPDERYAEVLTALASPERHFLFFGSTDEIREMEVASKTIRAQSTLFAGILEIMQVGALLTNCKLMIGNDSGLGHLSVALGVPTLRVFGPSDHFGCEPYTEGHATLFKNLTCSPCMNLGLIKPGYNVLNCGHRNCLQLIGVEEVQSAAKRIIGQVPQSKS